MFASRRFRQLLAVSVFLCSSAAAAATGTQAISTPGPSLFERSQFDAVGVARSTNLWLLAADGSTHELTARAPGSFDSGASNVTA